MQSLEDIPTWIASAWGIDLVSAQIIISAGVFFAFVVPILVLRKDRGSFNLEIVGGFFALMLCVGLGWLPFWILMVVIVIVAVAVAILGSDRVLGSR